MARGRQPRSWWAETVARWQRSGLTAAQFASREGLSAGTLRWWSSQLGRDNRATRHGRASDGRPAIAAIELALPAAARSATGTLEVAVGDAVVRFDTGVEVTYVAALVRALAGR